MGDSISSPLLGLWVRQYVSSPIPSDSEALRKCDIKNGKKEFQGRDRASRGKQGIEVG